MERKLAADRVYEKFEASIQWERGPKFDTLIVHLLGFRREQLKVQVTSSNKLRISGERPLGNNKWSSFRQELEIPSIYDAVEISAKFEGDKLFIKHPKIITQADHQQEEKPQAQAQAEAPKPQKPESDYSQAQKTVQDQQVNPPTAGPEKSGKVDPPKTSFEKQASRKASNGEVQAAFVEAKTAATQKSEDLVEERTSTWGANETMEKNKKVHDAAASVEADKQTAGSSNSNDLRDNKFRALDLKEALGDLKMEWEQRRRFMNIIVAVMLVLVAYIYAKSAIGYIGKSKD